MSLLAMKGVACVRGGRLLFESLDLGVSLGDAVQVSGPNGCGKSSLLRLAAGLLAASAGTLQCHVTVALADDSLALDRELTLGDAIGWWAKRDGGDLSSALDQLGLSDLAPVPVRLLSTGQARRARLARVAASGAKLWLLDEPLNGLDQHGIAQLDRAIAGHRASGGGVLAASHVRLGGEWRELALGQ